MLVNRECNHPTCGSKCRRLVKQKPRRRPIRHYSKKRQKENRTYSKESKDFLNDRPLCEIRSPVCTGKSQGVNHKAGRIGKNLMDITKWEASCNPRNVYCEDHPIWAIENGHKESRLKTVQKGILS